MDELITAVGSMAELATIFYYALLNKGIPEEIATKITCNFVSGLVANIVPPQK